MKQTIAIILTLFFLGCSTKTSLEVTENKDAVILRDFSLYSIYDYNEDVSNIEKEYHGVEEVKFDKGDVIFSYDGRNVVINPPYVVTR